MSEVNFNGVMIGNDMISELISLADLSITRCKNYYSARWAKTISLYKNSKKWGNKILGMSMNDSIDFLSKNNASVTNWMNNEIERVVDERYDMKRWIRGMEEFKSFVQQAVNMNANQIFVSQQQMSLLLNTFQE